MRKIIYILIGILAASESFSQDPIFSQFSFLNGYLNPATIGAEKGIKAQIGNRNQWLNVPGAFNSKYCAVNYQFSTSDYMGHGLSASVVSGQDGDASLTTDIGSIGYAIHGQNDPPFGIGRKLHFHMGFEFSFVQRSIDWQQLVFSDQLDAILGNIYQSEVNAPYEFDYWGQTGAFGIVIGSEFGGKKKGPRNRTSPLYQWSFGYSIHNMFSYRKSFYNYEVYSKERHTIHLDLFSPLSLLDRKTQYRKTIWGKTDVGKSNYRLSAKYDYQGGLKVVEFSNIFSNDVLFAGLGYRSVRFPFDISNVNQAVFYAGISNAFMKKKNYIQLIYSYDQSLNSLTSYVGTTHEISLSFYRSAGFNKDEKGKNKCYDYVAGGKLGVLSYPGWYGNAPIEEKPKKRNKRTDKVRHKGPIKLNAPFKRKGDKTRKLFGISIG